jgi:hypothetical protein
MSTTTNDGLDEAIHSAADHAIKHHTATVLRRDGLVLATVFPDTLLLELVANSTPLVGGTVTLRPDGRSVLVF